MARKKKRKKKEEKEEKLQLDTRTKEWIWGVLFFMLAIFFILARFDLAGVAGEYAFEGADLVVGIGFFMVPLLLFVLSFIFIRPEEYKVLGVKILGALFIFISGLGLASVLSNTAEGGYLGKALAWPLLRLFDVVGSSVILLGLLCIGFILVFKHYFSSEQDIALEWRNWKDALFKKDGDPLVVGEGDEELETPESVEEQGEVEEPEPQQAKAPALSMFKNKKEEKVDFGDLKMTEISGKPYIPPPLSLLQKDSGKPGVGDIKANSNLIKRTLQNFGIQVEMDEISIGPTVTRYALKPAEGVRLSKIVGLQNNLELALAAHPVRIEAPIPGKSLVGIEVPNSTKSTVGLAGLLASSEYRDSNKPLLIGMGRGISGKSYFADLGKAPHLLIAGATGSGKSVTIHAILNSLLFRNGPESLKFIMVDPKRVELTLYNGIPHLLTPVITQPKKAVLALKWAVKEMERRYEILEEYKRRDISSYHDNVYKPALKKAEKSGSAEDLPEPMPYLVVVVDELADLMQTYPRELEAEIVRLAQMSRAVGIHLLLSTQRPSKQVITGLIKANVPSRVALQVSSNIESRIILDTGGAEKLLGAGDMLYMSSDMSKPVRVQSAFISEKEVKSVTKYLKKQYEDELPDEVDLMHAEEKTSMFEAALDGSLEEEDDLYEDARMAVIEAGKASTSYLQRKLRVGYSRAARLMDMLEEQGVIGPQDGSKPRDVLVKASTETMDHE